MTTSGAAGLYATGGGTITTYLLNGVGPTVSTSGAKAYGAEADAGGEVSLTGGKVTTSGPAAGLYANGGVVNASGVAVVTGYGAGPPPSASRLRPVELRRSSADR